jgi:hypothetical protein
MPFLVSQNFEGIIMRAKKEKKLFHITLVYENNMTRTVKVQAKSRDIAETRALKRNPNAVGVKRDAS